MKIRAIRLRETGGIGEPMALEGLTGGLDVLSGRNELGKSTILKALRVVLFLKHGSTSTAAKGVSLKGLKPAGGGAPLVEVDFETSEGLWRLRKQFLAQKSASLAALEPALGDPGGNAAGTAHLKGRIEARGSDADEEAQRLIQASLGGTEAPALLWLGQQTSLAPPAPSAAQKTRLRQAVESEVVDAAGGGELRSLIAAVEAELKPLVHSKGAVKGGPYALALKSRDDLAAELTDARTALAVAEERLVNLQTLTTAEAELLAPGAREAIAAKVAAAADALKVANEARAELKTALSVLEQRKVEQRAAEQRLVDFDRQTKRAEALAGGLALSREKLQALEAEVQNAGDALATSKDRAKKLGEELTGVKAALSRLGAKEAYTAAQQRLAAHEERLAEAQTAQRQAAELGERITGSTVTKALVAAAREVGGAIGTLRAELNASAPKVSITYRDGASGRIRIGGVAVEDGAVLEPAGPLQLDIDGIGRITVAPGLASGIDDIRADLDAHEEQFAAQLEQMDVADLEAAEAALAARVENEQRQRELLAQVKALAPAGLEVLEAETARLRDLLEDRQREATALHAQSAAGDGAVEVVTAAARDGLDARRQELEAALQQLARDMEGQNEAVTAAREQLAQVVTARARDQEELDQLNARLPATELRSDTRLAMDKEASAATQAAAQALRAKEDWAQKAGDGARFEALQLALTGAQQEQAGRKEELGRLQREISNLRGALDVHADDNLEARVAELEAAWRRAQDDVTRMEQDIAALRLLHDELREAEQALQEQFVGPVEMNTAPYLRSVFPDGKLVLGDDLQVKGLHRAGTLEEFDILSDGTREQLAVLLRLGFARLLAQSGAPVPLILDDALVYSDDERIRGAFAALEQAAKLHQIIVLTCRETSFQALQGRYLSLSPWNVAATAVD